MKLKVTSTLIFLLAFSCSTQQSNFSGITDSEYFIRSMKKLSDVIVYDIFSPPVASRIYAYPSIAAYEALIPAYPEYQTLAGQLTNFEPVPQPSPDQEYSFELASLHAFLTVGRSLIFSEEKMEEYQTQLYQEIQEMGISSKVYQNSMDYGQEVADHILAWMNNDMYRQTRTFPKYSVREEERSWKPTPPDYMEGIEPHWNKIRPFVIDSANQFVPLPPTAFSLDPNSQFYKELVEVYEVGRGLNKEQTEIAQFWDCNPYVSQHYGHFMFATKKITPGGHWMGITAIACRTAGAGYLETVEAYAKTSISLSDGFISAWDEKWRSILVRPETLINSHLDEDWAPLLQTPPFPEHTSAHSVISASAATMLTDIFGPDFHFEDTTEMEYGLPMREFESFHKASEEAAISRFYGGIHYLPACEIGIEQGRQVGGFIVANLRTRKETLESSVQ